MTIGTGQSAAEFQSETIKVHRTTAITTVTTGAWTDFTGLTTIASESLGDYLSLNTDGKTIDVAKTGLYHFGGCVHYQDNSGGGFNALTILSRIYVNGTTETRCSQRGKDQTLRAGGEDILSYSGTAFLNENDKLTLQYYTNESNIRFFSNSNFANPLACTIWLIYSGDK